MISQKYWERKDRFNKPVKKGKGKKQINIIVIKMK